MSDAVPYMVQYMYPGLSESLQVTTAWWNLPISGNPALGVNPGNGGNALTKDGSNNISTVSDQSGMGFISTLDQATLANQPLFVADGGGGNPCIRFDGISGYLAHAAADLIIGGQMTVIAIAKSSSYTTASGAILSKHFTNNDFFLGGNSTGDGKVMFFVGGTGDDATKKAVSDSAIDNAVHVFMGTYDSTASPTTKLYVDGTLQATTATAVGNVGNSADDIALGAWSKTGTASHYLAHDLFFLAVYRSILTSSQVNAIIATMPNLAAVAPAQSAF